MLGGLVAGEGCFFVTRKPIRVADGREPKRFVFQVTMASRDRPLLEQLHAFLGVGHLRDVPPRHEHWQPTTTYTVNSVKAHKTAVIPFAERYLLASAKRNQFESWRETLVHYWNALPPRDRKGDGPNVCAIDSCGRPVRGAGVSVARTTTVKPAGYLAAFVGGFVAGEGTFTASGRKFVFAVGLGAADAGACDLLSLFFGCGSVHQRLPRRAGYDGEVTFSVQGFRDLVEVVVPFMDEHLPASYKRQQYEAWRASLMDYWENKARRGRPPCAIDGCELISRAKGLCRGHNYREFGA